MKHHLRKRKLGGRREFLLRSLAVSFVERGKIKTTEAKAKELRPFVEKLVTKGKNDSVSNRRLVSARLGNNSKAVKKIFDEISPKYKNRKGGYTRITKLAPRKSDASKMAIIEFV